jgi:hypothetical protein
MPEGTEGRSGSCEGFFRSVARTCLQFQTSERMKNNGTKALKNLLVWSAHRSRTLGTCARRYYFNYIGSWEGWDDNAPPEVQAA